jgi:hypothetical protein
VVILDVLVLVSVDVLVELCAVLLTVVAFVGVVEVIVKVIVLDLSC